MPLPINVITPALKLLGDKIDILPASGGAVEDLQRPDEDELEDMLIKEARIEKSSVPEKVITFVDELNKYALSGNKESPITQQVLDIVNVVVGWALFSFLPSNL